MIQYMGIEWDGASVSYGRHYDRAALGRHAGPGCSGSLGGLPHGGPTLHRVGARHHRHRSLESALLGDLVTAVAGVVRAGRLPRE